jgi:prepilin-type N-terminal cleavage/methylation domain-containing protein
MTLFYSRRHLRARSISPKTAGFSLPELLAVLVMIGLITTLSAPAWQAYHNRIMLSVGQDQVLQMMRQAQSKAKLHRGKWQSSFREVEGRVQGAVHPVNALPQEIYWEDLYKGLRIDTQRSTLPSRRGVYRVQFNHHGHVNGQLGRLTLMPQGKSRLRSCVITSTLIGALRAAKETRPKDRACSPARMS